MKYLIISIFLTFACSGLKSQTITEYVMDNSTGIDLSVSPFEQLSNLDSVVALNKFFFFGDGHMFNSDVLIQWFFLEYLYTKANVRNYIIERGPAETYALNKYVIEGDSTFFVYTVDYYLGLKSRRDFYRKVYEFNRAKQYKDKIKFYSFDKDLISNTALLQHFIKKKDLIPDAIRPMLDKIITAPVDVNNRRDFIVLLGELQSDIKNNSTDYKDFFEEDFPLVERIATNPNNNNRSDANIFNNFVNFYNEGLFQDGNFLCMYGFGHTVLDYSKVIGGMINEFFHQDVITFLPYYIDSHGKYGAKEKFYKSWGASIFGKSGFKNNKFADEAASVSHKPYTLVDLRGLPKAIKGKNELAAQFLIIFRDSESIH